VILHPGRADAWWHGPAGLARFDAGELWAGEVHLSLPERPQLWPTTDGWIARCGDEWIRIIGTRVERSTRARYGEALTATRSSQWTLPPLELPSGAQTSPTLQPFPTGRGALWTHSGFVYRLTDRVTVVCAATTFIAGPQGACLAGHRAAPPRGSARSIPPLAGPVRWRPDGCALRGMDGEETLSIDLENGVVQRQTGVLPVSYDASLHLKSGEIREGETLLQWGVIEASCALRGPRLAGPGGVIWDLRIGAPLFRDPRILLGATVATPRGFATVHWETGRGQLLSPEGEHLDDIRLPLDEDDVISGAGEGGTFRSAAGHSWTAEGVPCEPTRPREAPSSAEVDGRRFTWNDSGRLSVDGGPDLTAARRE